MLFTLLFAASPDISQAFNLAWDKAFDGTTVIPTQPPCDYRHAKVDTKNAFISVDAPSGPDCANRTELEFTAFKRADGTFVWLLNEDDTLVRAFVLQDGKMEAAPATVASIPTLKQLLGIDSRESPFITLPRQGTTLRYFISSDAIARLCTHRTDAWCTPAKDKTWTAKWNREKGVFDPPQPE